MNRIEPWKIAVIVVSVIAGLAFVIGLITFFLCHGKCTTLTCCHKSSGICCVSLATVVLPDDLGIQSTPGIKSTPGIEST